MSLDISFTAKENIYCPHCGEIVGQTVVRYADGGGRGWYDLLESFGYYIPLEQREGKYDWYGKDMELTPQQVEEAFRFARNDALYGSLDIYSLLADAQEKGLRVVVNADW